MMTPQTNPICPFCSEPHAVAPTVSEARALLGTSAEPLTVPVTAVEFRCEATGEVFENSRAHDWRAEARGKLNALLGQPAETRVPGVRLLRNAVAP